MEYGTFCNIYGKTLRNGVIEHILERDNLDFAVSDLLEELEISKPQLYSIIKTLEEEHIIKKTRVIGKTQLYQLEKENNKTKLLMRSFRACITIALEEYNERAKHNKKRVLTTTPA